MSADSPEGEQPPLLDAPAGEDVAIPAPAVESDEASAGEKKNSMSDGPSRSEDADSSAAPAPSAGAEDVARTDEADGQLSRHPGAEAEPLGDDRPAVSGWDDSQSAPAQPRAQPSASGEGKKPPSINKSKGKGTAKAAATAKSVPPSARRMSGRELILAANRDASVRVANGSVRSASGAAFSTGLHLNGWQQTTAEENAQFRARAGASRNYRGPIFVAEDVHVPCALCGGPLDPVTRVPAGTIFFHSACIRCYVCGRHGLTEPYVQVRDSNVVLCSHCAAKGFEPSVRKELAAATRRQTSRGPVSKTPAVAPPGPTAPSLSIGPLHTVHNTSRGSLQLMERQQYYTRSDCNLLLAKSMMTDPSQTGVRTAHRAAEDQEALEEQGTADALPSADELPTIE